MKTVASIALVIAAVLLPASATGQQRAAEVLTNESIVQMVLGKVPKGLILTKIQSTSTAFDLTPTGLASLNRSKVTGDIVKEMMKASTAHDAKELLTNDGVILMVTSQVPKDVIIMKIQSTKSDFDLTAAGLVHLNQSKVPQDVMKAMMAPPPVSAPPVATQPPPVSPPTAAPPAASAPRKVSDGETAAIKTTLSVADASAKVKAYLKSRNMNFTVDKETVTSDWYGERACTPSPNRCAMRAIVHVAVDGKQAVVHVQVFERKREGGAAPKPWVENAKANGKDTTEFADALEAYIIK